VLSTKYNYKDEVKEDQMDKRNSTNGVEEEFIRDIG
jgi:hypothetical protein